MRNPAVFVDVINALEPAIANHAHIRVCPSESAFENREVVFAALAIGYGKNTVIKHINNQQGFCCVTLFLAGVPFTLFFWGVLFLVP